MYLQIDYLFHNASYHRFHFMAAILEHFVVSAPRAVRIEQLINDIEMTEPEIRKTCSSLCEMGLILNTENADHWILAGPPEEITLEDVMRSVLFDEQTTSIKSPTSRPRESSSDIDLLIEQALIAINQSISMHLKKFNLGRIKTAQSGFFISLNQRRLMPDLICDTAT